MIVDSSKKLTFGFREWLALAMAFVTPTTMFTGWVWRLSDRMIILEQYSQTNAQILQRLDAANTAMIADRAQSAQRFTDIERRLSGIEETLKQTK